MSRTCRSMGEAAEIRAARRGRNRVDIGAIFADRRGDDAERAGLVEQGDHDLRGIDAAGASPGPSARRARAPAGRRRRQAPANEWDRSMIPSSVANPDDALARHRAAPRREATGVSRSMPRSGSASAASALPGTRKPGRPLGEAEPAALVLGDAPAPPCAPPGNRDRPRARRRRRKSRPARRR